MSDDTRINRELETREASVRPRRWVRPSVLPSPNPRKGWAHRWVRVANYGVQDPTNVSSKLREGWEFCRAKDYPEIQIMHVENEAFKENLLMGGQVLCRAPEELVAERTEHYRNQTAAQMRSVDHNLMKESDPRMPVFNESKSEIQFGKGKRPN